MRHLLTLPVQNIQLVFGLDWLPLISGKAASTALRVARRRRATHMVMDGESPASFAFGTPRLSREHRRWPMHSAAQSFARLYPRGSAACILTLDSDVYWLVAANEGAVMSRSDLIFRSRQQAQAVYENMRLSHPRLSLLNPEHIGLNLESLASASDPGTALRDTGLRRIRRLLVLFLFSALGIACTAGYRSWLFQPDTPDLSEVANAKIEEKWRAAINEVEHNIRLHGVAATHAALKHVYNIPVQISGWALVRVECRADGPLWRCVSELNRQHPHANNRGLMNSVPKQWALSFPSIETARASWEFRTFVQTAVTKRLHAPVHNKRHFQSALQGIRMAFNRIELGGEVPIALRMPVDDTGRALPPPQSMPRYTRRSVQIEGPLRSLSLLLPYTESIGWRSLSLAVGPPTFPSSTNSQLRVTLHGELYERHEATT